MSSGTTGAIVGWTSRLGEFREIAVPHPRIGPVRDDFQLEEIDRELLGTVPFPLLGLLKRHALPHGRLITHDDIELAAKEAR